VVTWSLFFGVEVGQVAHLGWNVFSAVDEALGPVGVQSYSSAQQLETPSRCSIFPITDPWEDCIFTYLDLPKGAKWLLKGVNSTSL